MKFFLALFSLFTTSVVAWDLPIIAFVQPMSIAEINFKMLEFSKDRVMEWKAEATTMVPILVMIFQGINTGEITCEAKAWSKYNFKIDTAGLDHEPELSISRLICSFFKQLKASELSEFELRSSEKHERNQLCMKVLQSELFRRGETHYFEELVDPVCNFLTSSHLDDMAVQFQRLVKQLSKVYGTFHKF